MNRDFLAPVSLFFETDFKDLSVYDDFQIMVGEKINDSLKFKIWQWRSTTMGFEIYFSLNTLKCLKLPFTSIGFKNNYGSIIL